MASNVSKIATVVIAATIAVTLLSPISTITADSTGDVSVTNETVTANNEFQDLRGYDIQSGSVSVEDSDGNAVDSGNYSVRYNTGEIRVDNSTSTVVTDGETVYVDYTYTASDDTTTTVAGLVPLLFALVILVALATKLQEMM